MSNVSDIKPWFKEDIARTLTSIYFTSKQNGRATNDHFEIGFAAAISSVALAVGINPEAFLSPEDIQRLKARVNA